MLLELDFALALKLIVLGFVLPVNIEVLFFGAEADFFAVIILVNY